MCRALHYIFFMFNLNSYFLLKLIAHLYEVLKQAQHKKDVISIANASYL